MDLFKSLLILIAAGVVTAMLSLIVARAKAPPDVRGWRHVKPSAMHWTGIALGGGLCVVMVYVRLFVGSSRADAETQMTILTCLIVAFGLLTLVTAISAYAILRRAIRWRGTMIVFQGKSGFEQRRLDDITQIHPNAVGQVVLTFLDGTILRIDPYARGSSELLELAQENLNKPK